jgi:DNA-binding NtrC family response regulator
LLVEDDDDLRHAYTAHMAAHGFTVEEAADLASAYKSFRGAAPDVAILDFRLPDGTALELLPRFKEMEPTVPIIVLTGFGSMELGVSLIKNGAEQCLSKPVEASALLMIVERVLENSRNQQKQRANTARRNRLALNPFLGESTAIKRLSEAAAKVANSQSPVLMVKACWPHGCMRTARAPRSPSSI